MSYLWDSNIIRHYLQQHPRLQKNIQKISHDEVMLPVVVAAEQIRGRSDAISKAEPHQLARLLALLDEFSIELLQNKQSHRMNSVSAMQSTLKRTRLVSTLT